MNKRIGKGQSLIKFLDEYIVVDLETTGFDFSCDIIEIGALKVSKGKIIDSFHSFTRPNPFYLPEDNFKVPHYIDTFISSLTGITDEMVKNAPVIKEILPTFKAFIGDSVVVGHNIASFDSNFLYDAYTNCLNLPFTNDFVDTLRLSKWLLPNLGSHRLDDMCYYFGITRKTSHRSLDDCLSTKSCYDELMAVALSSYETIDNFYSYVHQRQHKSSLKANDITTTNTEFDISNPLYNSVCVFTGKLEKMTRREAMQIVKDLGGINGDTITKSTNFLILGNNDFCSTIKDGKSTKQKKAEKLRLEGQDIEIISENMFYTMAGIE